MRAPHHLLGIGGEKEAGKDTIADFFVKNHGFVKLSFATPLKEMVAKAFDIPLIMFNDTTMKKSEFPMGKITLDETMVSRLCEQANELEPLTDEHRGLLKEELVGKSFSTPREMLQIIGTNVFREKIDDNYWVKLAMKTIGAAPKVVFADARFTNERNAIHQMGGTLLLVHRPGKDEEKKDAHKSENDLGREEDYDVVVMNNETIHKLEAGLHTWYEYIASRRIV